MRPPLRKTLLYALPLVCGLAIVGASTWTAGSALFRTSDSGLWLVDSLHHFSRRLARSMESSNLPIGIIEVRQHHRRTPIRSISS